MFLQRPPPDTERETLILRELMETMETQTITNTNSLSPTQTHIISLSQYDADSVCTHARTHTHTYCQGSFHPTAVAAPQAQLREGNAETYRESER